MDGTVLRVPRQDYYSKRGTEGVSSGARLLSFSSFPSVLLSREGSSPLQASSEQEDEQQKPCAVTGEASSGQLRLDSLSG